MSEELSTSNMHVLSEVNEEERKKSDCFYLEVVKTA